MSAAQPFADIKFNAACNNVNNQSFCQRSHPYFLFIFSEKNKTKNLWLFVLFFIRISLEIETSLFLYGFLLAVYIGVITVFYLNSRYKTVSWKTISKEVSFDLVFFGGLFTICVYDFQNWAILFCWVNIEYWCDLWFNIMVILRRVFWIVSVINLYLNDMIVHSKQKYSARKFWDIFFIIKLMI